MERTPVEKRWTVAIIAHLKCEVRGLKLQGGFTLIELLIVIAIVGVLIGLLLPTVQAARESARRTQCMNHLKQMGLATLEFYDAGRVMPTGGNTFYSAPIKTASGQLAFPPKQEIGWAVQILTFLEESNAQDQTFIQILQTPIQTYFCPSRRGSTLVNTPSYGTRAGLDYCAVTGATGEYYRGLIGSGSPPGTYDAVIVRASAVDPAGPQFSPKCIRLKDITDGTSRSMVFSEKRMDPTAYETGCGGDDNGFCEGWDMDIIRMTNSDPNLLGTNVYVLAMDAPAPVNDWNLNNSLGSAHAGGVYAVFADGAVHLISYEINQQLLDSLGNRHDGLLPEMNGVY